MTPLRVITCVVVAVLLLAGCSGEGGDNATRSFVGKTDDLVLYVTWNRDGNELSGALTQGQLEDGKQVQTSRASLAGKISGSGVTLDLTGPYGPASLTGKLEGDALSLEYLRAGEGLVTVDLDEGDAGVFNSELAALSDRVEQAKADELSEAGETSEKDRVGQHAQVVEDDIVALRTAVATALSAKVPNRAVNLARLRRDLQTLRDHAQAAVRGGDRGACASAASVKADLSTLESHAAALANKQTARDRDRGSVDAAIDKLREDFLTLQDDDPRYLPPEAPTQRAVGRAIQQARRKLRKAGSSSGDTSRAVDAILKEARALDGRASALCGSGAPSG
ncbi:hypothetical protein BH20ACT17_BH20ACT17_07160 [soil metagenome]